MPTQKHRYQVLFKHDIEEQIREKSKTEKKSYSKVIQEFVEQGLNKEKTDEKQRT